MREFARESTVHMVTPDEPGAPMSVRGRVVRVPDGEPVPGVVVQITHTDASGRYESGEGAGSDRCARLFCHVRTDAKGRFELRTIRPAPYSGSSERAAHVHVRIRADGYWPFGDTFRPLRPPEQCRGASHGGNAGPTDDGHFARRRSLVLRCGSAAVAVALRRPGATSWPNC